MLLFLNECVGLYTISYDCIFDIDATNVGQYVIQIVVPLIDNCVIEA